MNPLKKRAAEAFLRSRFFLIFPKDSLLFPLPENNRNGIINKMLCQKINILISEVGKGQKQWILPFVSAVPAT